MNFQRIKSYEWNCFEAILKCKYIQEWAVVIYFDLPWTATVKYKDLFVCITGYIHVTNSKLSHKNCSCKRGFTCNIFNVCVDKIGHGSVASELYWNLEIFLNNLLSKNGEYSKELLYLFLIKLLIWYQQDFVVYVIRHQNV